MLPSPESNFCIDSNGVGESNALLQTQCAVSEASTEVNRAVPLPPSASTHIRKFTLNQEGADASNTVELGFEKRNREFAVGRHCAQAALQQFGITADVPVDVDRKPVWPAGIAGSISHSHHYAWATVLKQDAVLKSIGIDTEIIVDDATLGQVVNEITTEAEQARLSDIHSDHRTAFTILFSAKESIYKCLYPMNQQFFGFHDVELIAATDQTVTFAQQPSNPNYSIAPRQLTAHYTIHQNDVFSAIWI